MTRVHSFTIDRTWVMAGGSDKVGILIDGTGEEHGTDILIMPSTFWKIVAELERRGFRKKAVA